MMHVPRWRHSNAVARKDKSREFIGVGEPRFGQPLDMCCCKLEMLRSFGVQNTSTSQLTTVTVMHQRVHEATGLTQADVVEERVNPVLHQKGTACDLLRGRIRGNPTAVGRALASCR